MLCLEGQGGRWCFTAVATVCLFLQILISPDLDLASKEKKLLKMAERAEFDNSVAVKMQSAELRNLLATGQRIGQLY